MPGRRRLLQQQTSCLPREHVAVPCAAFHRQGQRVEEAQRLVEQRSQLGRVQQGRLSIGSRLLNELARLGGDPEDTADGIVCSAAVNNAVWAGGELNEHVRGSSVAQRRSRSSNVEGGAG